MAIDQRLTSSHFPYIPVQLELDGLSRDFEALLDTGFDGDVVIPTGVAPAGRTPDVYLPCRLADGSEVLAPVHRGTARIGDFEPFTVAVMALGDEELVGRGVSDRFTITLEHGQTLIIEA